MNVSLGIDRHRLDTKFLARPDDSDGNLTAIGN